VIRRELVTYGLPKVQTAVGFPQGISTKFRQASCVEQQASPFSTQVKRENFSGADKSLTILRDLESRRLHRSVLRSFEGRPDHLRRISGLKP
jgi:hypothetical protein